MNYNKINISILLFFTFINCVAQNRSIHSKYYVKETEVLLRWVPENKEIFDLGVRNGYKITRYLKEGATLSSPQTLSDNISPFPVTDSLNWKKLIRVKSRAAMIYSALYTNKSSGNIPQKEKDAQDKMTYGLVLLSCDFDALIAKACGLYFKDSTISPGKTYVYQIEINNPPAATKINPATLEINTAILSVNPEIKNLSGKTKNKAVELRWKASDFSNSYSGYNIERSADNITFKKINISPLILITTVSEKKKEFIEHTDTVPTTKKQYYYRIKGINFFGEESLPSNMISATGFDELTSTPHIDSLKVIENKKVFLHWKMSDERENTKTKEYILTRSEKDNGKYDMLFKSNVQFSFIDETPKQSNYYKIGAITYGNDTLFSFSKLALIADTIPPTVPTGIKAKVDTKGNVEITWDKNPENDVQGYKIYKANALTEEFVQINNEFAKNTFYKDKLNLKTLSKKIFYCVAATDNNYNSSELSNPIEVKRPDTIPPVASIIKGLQISQKGINVSRIPSSSEDVKQYVLYHQDEKTRTDVKVKAWSNSDTATSFTDTTVEIGQGYRYKIIVMDEDDKISISNIPYMFFETGYRKKIMDIKFFADRTRKTISLSWNYPERQIEKFIIYRAKAKEPLTIIKTLAYPTSTFEDNTLNIGNTYEYRIKAVFSNGAESIISDAVIVEY